MPRYLQGLLAGLAVGLILGGTLGAAAIWRWTAPA